LEILPAKLILQKIRKLYYNIYALIVMKKIAIIIIIIACLSLALSSLNFAEEKTKDYDSDYQAQIPKLAFDYKNFSLSPASAQDEKRLAGTENPGLGNFNLDHAFQRIKDAISQFKLAPKMDQRFSLKKYPLPISIPEKRTYYSKTAFEILELNFGLWAFDRYLMNETWAKINLKTILNNIGDGFEWDYDTFVTNQLGHPYHGAMFYTLARTNGLGFFESTLYTSLGSYFWEVFMESNHPSTNDMIMTSFGGVTLGEALYRMAELIDDENTTSLGRAFRESLCFFVNPVYGLKVLTANAYKLRDSQGRRNYVLNFPFGASNSSSKETSFVLEANMEYRDYLRNNPSGVGPYDWFSLNCKFGLHDNGFHDKELCTSGVLIGKKIKDNLAGLFGVFDYINTHLAEKMSALGFGPGLVTSFTSDSNLFFNSSGILSVIFGGSSPSIDLENYHLGKRDKGPYFLGTGMLGKINLEFGKEGLGSIQTGLSRYWVRSMSTPANEYLFISSLNINYDLSAKSQIRFEYDYYLRNGTFEEQSASQESFALRALYVFKF